MPRFNRNQAKYPWDTWTNGELHTITYGHDFQVTVQRMAITVYGYGKRHDLYPCTHITGNSLQLIFFDNPDEAETYRFPNTDHFKTGVRGPDIAQHPCQYPGCGKQLTGQEIAAGLTECTGATNIAEFAAAAQIYRETGEFPRKHASR